MEKEVLESMFARGISDNLMDFICVPIDEGGLGLLNYNDINNVAHVASFFGEHISFLKKFVNMLGKRGQIAFYKIWEHLLSF